MKTLKDIQLQFQQSLFVEQQQLALHDLDFISSSYAKERFSVYRQTLLENLRNTLELTFPGLWVLLGAECANSIAYAFIKKLEHLPTTCCLDDWGYEFTSFFETVTELISLPYLKDVAVLEWFKHLSYYAAEMDGIDLSSLQHLSEQQLNEVKFNFQPSVFLLQSPFPLQKIFEVIENPNAEAVDLSGDGAYAVVVRIEHRVEIYWVCQQEWHFLNALKQGKTLPQAYEQEPSVDITKMILFMFDKKLVSRI